jgi:tRNA threonylcarbamoyl adenosine modification protein YeaZ
MKILAVETSGKSFSVGLNIDGQTVTALYYNCGLMHSEKLIDVINNALEITGNSLQDIDKFAVSTGPGSFTGIRVGMTVIKTMAQALNKPIIAMDSLTILEAGMIEIKGIKIIAAINALRDEVYIKQKNKIIIKSLASLLDSLKRYKNKVLIIGDAAIVYREKIKKVLGKYAVSLPPIMHFPKASALAKEACHLIGQDYSKISPLYIRRSWAEESKDKKT